MQYIRVENGIITEHLSSATPIDGAIAVSDFYGTVGDPVAYYNDDWSRKPDIELYKNGLMNIPEGKVLDGETLRDMTEVEKIQAGILALPSGMKISNGELVSMSQEELLEAGLITQEDVAKDEAQRLHAELQAYLSDTDYAVIKCSELKLNLETEYPGLSEKRAQARAKINELESEYAELRMAKPAYPILE